MSLKVIIIVLLAIVAIVLVVLALRKKKEKPEAPALPNLADLKIQDARIGDIVLIRAAGDEFEDLSFSVDRKHRYESGRGKAYEISGLYKNRRVHVEWSDEDILEIAVGKKSNIPLSKIGLTEDDLVKMDENQDEAHTFNYDGSAWRFAGSGEIVFFENNGRDGEGYYNWDFESDDATRKLSIEKWEEDPFEAGVAESVAPEDVTILRG